MAGSSGGAMISKMLFRGPLRKQIVEFIAFRKSLGFTMRNTAYVYSEFDRYLKKHYPTMTVVRRQMVIGYLSTTAHLHSTSRSYRVTLIRGLCRYLYQQDSRNYVPEPKLLPYGKRKLTPHIFSDSEINRIIEKLKRGPKRKISTLTNSTVIALLSVTGLRIGEICRLNIEDVDFKNSLLRIQRSKFYKSRIVPISRSTVDALILYKQTRVGYYRTTDPTAPFFVEALGKRLHENGVGRKFRKALRDLKICTNQGTTPRLHDLRHTFATRSLENVYQSSNDPQASLPALATYLGHVNLDYTQTYLHPSVELLRSAGERFKSHARIQNGAEI